MHTNKDNHDPFIMTGEGPAARLLLSAVTPPLAYILATSGVAIAVVASYSLGKFLPHPNLSLLFMAAVLLTATKTGLWPAIYSAVLGFLAYNYFFTTPYYTLNVDKETDVATLVFFLVMAMLAGALGSRLRTHVERTRTSMERMADLAAFSRSMAAAADAREVLEALVDYLDIRLNFGAVVETTDRTPPIIVSGRSRASSEPYPVSLIHDDIAHPGWERYELATASGCNARMAVQGLAQKREQRVLVSAMCSQAAVALERIHLVEELEHARVNGEREQLRSALLSSVSHDLRTPLVSVIGSVSTLLEMEAGLRPADRRELLETVLSEAKRLNRYIQNLLDMTRLGHGSLALNRDWSDINDIISSACQRIGSNIESAELAVSVEGKLPLLFVHSALLEQALVNILDNALQFSPKGSPVKIQAYREEDCVIVDIIDSGPGIPEAERNKIFDMFYSACRGDGGPHGTGLGLTIAHGMIGAHGGSIKATAGPGGHGTCMHITLPVRPMRENAE